MEFQPIEGIPAIIAMAAKNLGIFTIVMLVVAYVTLAERRVSAFIQDRRGPSARVAAALCAAERTLQRSVRPA